MILLAVLTAKSHGSFMCHVIIGRDVYEFGIHALHTDDSAMVFRTPPPVPLHIRSYSLTTNNLGKVIFSGNYGPRPSIFVASGGLIFTNHNQVFNILRIKTIHILPTCDRKFILLSQVYSLS